jgi:hypothetical protein
VKKKMIGALRMVLLFAAWACVLGQAPPQTSRPPAEYQIARLKFRIVDLDGRSLDGATVFVRMDASSTRLPPDRQIRATAGGDEIAYDAGDRNFRLHKGDQTTNSQGLCEVPFIVYANRTDPIDYELSVAYGNSQANQLSDREAKLPVYPQDDGKTIWLHARVHRILKWPQYLAAAGILVASLAVGWILFFQLWYPVMLHSQSIPRARALVWLSTLLLLLAAFAFDYWMYLPLVVAPLQLFVFLFALWLVGFLVAFART